MSKAMGNPDDGLFVRQIGGKYHVARMKNRVVTNVTIGYPSSQRAADALAKMRKGKQPV